jgi:hypothetical protein
MSTAPPRKEPPLFDRLPIRAPVADGGASPPRPVALDGDGVSPTDRIELLERENAQLREALRSRLVIEQAKGVLAERYRIDVEQAFEILRRTARSNRMRIHALAAAVAASASAGEALAGGFQRTAGSGPGEGA